MPNFMTLGCILMYLQSSKGLLDIADSKILNLFSSYLLLFGRKFGTGNFFLRCLFLFFIIDVYSRLFCLEHSSKSGKLLQ